MISNPEAFLGRSKECNEILESPRGSKDILGVYEGLRNSWGF